MPGPYGSLANPVPLDPFQEIVAVHWPSRWIAARLNVDLAVTIGGEDAVGPGLAFVEPFSQASMTAGTYSYLDGDALTDFQVFAGGIWSPLPSDDITQSGAPTLPGPYSYDLWLWQGIDAFGCKEPYPRFDVGDEGAALATLVPGHSDEHFTDGLAGNLILRAQGFVAGGPYIGPFAGLQPMWATAEATGSSPSFVPVLQDAETESVSVSGMTIELEGKTYAAIGTKVIPADNPVQGEFWVLFSREAPTP
ncbi:hypothetical protein [Mesorhizobium sp.]|uniref:hypothetical protein n=1 Tax=Mesorhizobium sp. TaxID=1871066 RepID=UPI0011FC25CA|nr:hypothetical protein [Mesorhizobium sp.]TIL34327.1 MAG: hypothetical protein E5Y85_11340 [Mesorhizobium sp.]